ncbi:MAG: hypothetical protein VX527_02195 [Planctomycetota bacterium]|nr:hypothetical protein [Planctomycetota bacterium]
MASPRRVVLLLALLVLACGLNLVLMRWGTDLPETAILTFTSDSSPSFGIEESKGFGLYTTPFLESTPWVSLAFGLVLPLLILGLVAYILIRPHKASNES